MTQQHTHPSGWPRRLVCLAALALSGVARGGEFQDEPWSVSSAAPVLAATPAASLVADHVSVSRTVCFGWLTFYQRVLHVVTISHCPMHPSCSNYSLAAVNKYGAFRGVLLTADRLLHESDEQHFAPVIRRNGRSLYFDPVESNDFWWRTP